jgi:hypothetical protein
MLFSSKISTGKNELSEQSSHFVLSANKHLIIASSSDAF